VTHAPVTSIDDEQVYKFVQALTTDNTTKAAKSADLAKLGKRLLAQMDGADVDDDVDNEVSVELHAKIAAHFPNGARPEQVAPACCIGLLGKCSRLARLWEQVYEFLQALTAEHETSASKYRTLRRLGRRMLAEMAGEDASAMDEEDEEENAKESQLADALNVEIAARFPNGASQDEV
jgi:hypothetical protein